jgi:hypothetical protein
MPRIFSLANPEFEIPSINHLELEWAGAAQGDLARQIGFQDQFRRLFRYIFLNLQSVPGERPNWNPRPLALSVRAGAIKTYVLLSVSIAEGALAALGEERNLGRREGELFQRTFGGLLTAWEENGRPRAEVANIWEDMQLLKRYRNYVHLNRAAQEEAGWQEILENEQHVLGAADNVVSHLRNLCHIFRDP